MNDIITSVTAVFNSIPSDVWALAGGSIGVAYAGRFLKHLFGVNDRKVITTVVTALSFVGPALQFLIASQGNNIFSVIPHSAEIMAGATIFYNVIVKGGRFDTFLKNLEGFQAQEEVTTTAPVTPVAPSEFDV